MSLEIVKFIFVLQIISTVDFLKVTSTRETETGLLWAPVKEEVTNFCEKFWKSLKIEIYQLCN